MEEIDSSPVAPTSPNPLKRGAPDGNDTPGKKPLNLKGSQFAMPTPPDTEESSNSSPQHQDQNQTGQRQGSPAASSISSLSSVEIASEQGAVETNQSDNSKPNQPPAKRRKLTPSEKLEKQLAKEAKEKEKTEQKARKDEVKRVKDEEKRRKAEEREAKRREKDLEEQRKTEEKLKKERSQMRLGAFFGAKPTVTPTKRPLESGEGSSTRRKSLSLEPFDNIADQIRRSQSPTKGTQPNPQGDGAQPTPAKPIPEKTKTVSDYRRHFLPYELPTHSTMAQTFSIPNPDDYAYWQGAFDDELKDPSFREKVDLGLIEPSAVVDHMFKSDGAAGRGTRQYSIRTLVDHIQGTSSSPIDLTHDTSTARAPLLALQDVSRRYLHFSTDVRPPYFGTYTKIRSPRSTRRMMINPFSRTRTDTDYDYDSEAEWEEPEEGEDICGDDEDDAESLGDEDEMDAFLDDSEDSLKNKRKLITGDLQPTSTGLCWENEKAVAVQSIGDGGEILGAPKEMQDMKIGCLLPNFSGCTIDPFSTEYWAGDMAAPPVPLGETPLTTQGTLAPVRPPLQERHSNGSPTQTLLIGAAEGEKGPITSSSATQGNKRGPKPQAKTLNKEDLDEFKEAVVGSPLGKVELCKGLKTRFPKMTMETIKEALSSQFAQVGSKKAEKKWVFVSAS
ncbi:hypothetical protein KC332_g791 [Hortaea werneckii]|uniref:Chromatin assembly factor 1 subunit A n=2 Tax=Hortaea werneckii TaxID=91943 RepID=A0A3M7IZY8_HORWE|nr:hypothetical protein KC350_g5999 [Hortaea werneckii]OTA37100.1 hypothetical protein BTJ68_03178 [Hortaea werneckii EXF-2000]KAI6850353.1 hypothetical protein KC358_g763 [Hortaea werneckii]KAI6944533.1 hypothetical protein KC341_g763 [Hortaea werneckii]KAI6951095.1 hypothetical protein KC348_g290 [Hortaea werneckii]